MKRLSLAIALVICSVGFALAQRTVTGTITDQSGEPLIGASILVKGTSTGTVSDFDGNFTLQVPEGANVLVVSYTGFSTQEIEVGARSVIEVSMQEGIVLSEAVVTALGIERSEKSVPYAVQQVGEEQLNTIRQTNLNNALAGKIAGIQVRGQASMALDRNPSVRIRGVGSLSEKSPLYVVDGTPVNSNDVNLDDVESVSVLKGPSATALYGQRGEAGVILITTKRGAQRPGIGIEVNQSTFFDRVYILPEYQNEYAGGGEPELIEFQWQNGMPEEWKIFNGKFYHDYSDDASWGPKMEGQEYIPWYAWYVGTPDFGKTARLVGQPDNIRDYYETGVTTNNNINFSKAGEGFTLRASYTNQNVKGLLPNSKQEKHLLSTMTTYDLGKHFTLGANINYVTNKVEGTFDDSYANQSSGSFNQWFHRNIDMKKLKELRDMRSPEGILGSWNHLNPGAYLSSPLDFYGGNYWYNFYTWFDYINNVSNRQRLYGDISLTYKLDDHFKIAGFVRKNQVTSNYENKTPAILENSATQTGVFNGYATGQTYSTEDNYELLATYFNRFGDLSLDLNAGGNIRQDRYKDITGSTAQGLSVPDLYRLDNSVQQPFNYGEFRSKKEVRSIYARGSFGFKDYLYLDWSVRRDWSSALPANKNGYTYPSVGMSFVFSEFLNTSWFSYGKLRGSFAQIGSDLAAYGLALNYAKGQNFGSDFTMATPDLLVDPNIEPSLSSSYEVGLDLRFLQNRLGLSATYYSESRKNEIIDVAVTGVSGFTGKRINAGQIDRSGIELQLNAVPVSAKDLSWDITLNFAKADNKIIELAEGIDAQEIGASFFATRTGVRVINRVGEPWGQLRGGGFKRINGQPVLTESGLYVAAPDTYFGSVLPDYTGGFFNSLQYKNFILLFNIDFQSGGKYFSLSESWGYFSGLFDETAALNENGKNVRDPVSEGGGVKVTGVDANGNPVTKFVEASDYFHQFYFQRVGEQFIHDASFIKLREVSLGYDIPVKKIGLGNAIQRLNISLVARNPLLIYAANRDFDPSEFGQYAYGEMGQFPGTRSIGFNIKVGF